MRKNIDRSIELFRGSGSQAVVLIRRERTHPPSFWKVRRPRLTLAAAVRAVSADRD